MYGHQMAPAPKSLTCSKNVNLLQQIHCPDLVYPMQQELKPGPDADNDNDVSIGWLKTN